MDHRIRRLFQYDKNFDIVVGIMGYTAPGTFYYNSSSVKNACCNPVIFKMIPGKRYKFDLTGTTYEYGVAIRKLINPVPDQDEYTCTAGVTGDLVTCESWEFIHNTNYLRVPYEYDCTDSNLTFTVYFERRNKANITEADLAAIKNSFSIKVEEM